MKKRLPGVVLDTNIVISAVLKLDGLESRILRQAVNGELKLYLSPPILIEYAEVLQRQKFRLSEAAQQQILEGLKAAGTVVIPRRRLLVSPDPEDNMFIECAEAARADFLVTGNLRHFPAGWKGTRIVSSREFLSSM